MIEDKLRQLARSSYYQSLYKASKENGIKLFENDTNLSGLQVVFLYWLSLYDFLYDTLARKEYDFLTEKYIDSNVRVDAFLYYRKRQNELELAKSKEEQLRQRTKFKGKKGKQTYFDVEFA